MIIFKNSKMIFFKIPKTIIKNNDHRQEPDKHKRHNFKEKIIK